MIGFDEIDESTRPRLRPEVELFVLGGAPTLLDGREGRVVPIGRTAALAAPLLTGDASLGELATDVASVFAIEPQRAVDDLVRMTRHLAVLDLIENVARLPSDWLEPAADANAPDGAPLSSPEYLAAPPNH